LETLVANAQHIKRVPGRKTDVKDAEWIADLCRNLDRPAFLLTVAFRGSGTVAHIYDRQLNSNVHRPFSKIFAHQGTG
jgi:hypothetical protein